MRILCHIYTFNDEEVIERCVEFVPVQTRPADQLLTFNNESRAVEHLTERERAGAGQ